MPLAHREWVPWNFAGVCPVARVDSSSCFGGPLRTTPLGRVLVGILRPSSFGSSYVVLYRFGKRLAVVISSNLLRGGVRPPLVHGMHSRVLQVWGGQTAKYHDSLTPRSGNEETTQPRYNVQDVPLNWPGLSPQITPHQETIAYDIARGRLLLCVQLPNAPEQFGASRYRARTFHTTPSCEFHVANKL